LFFFGKGQSSTKMLRVNFNNKFWFENKLSHFAVAIVCGILNYKPYDMSETAAGVNFINVLGANFSYKFFLKAKT